MDGANAFEVVAAALRRSGLQTALRGDREALHVFAEPGEAVVALRVTGGFWLLDHPGRAGEAPSIRAVGKVATLPVEVLAAAVHAALGVPPAEVDAAPPSAVSADALAAEVLTRLSPMLARGVGLSGFLKADLASANPYLRLDTRTGIAFNVTVRQNRVLADVAGLDGRRILCCVGLVGCPEEAMARRVIAATRTFSDVSSVRGSVDQHDLSSLATMLAGPFGAHLVREQDAHTVVVLLDTASHRGARLAEVGRVIYAEVDDIVEVFGSLGSEPVGAVAEEITARLALSPLERDALAAAWDQDGAELTARLEAVTAAARAAGDAHSRDVLAVAEQALKSLIQLRSRAGRQGFVEAHGLVEDVVAMVERPAPPAPRLIRQWADAEDVAAQWMEWFGFGPARLTGGSADGGVDVECEFAVGQVKDYGSAVAAGPVREIYAIATVIGKDAVIFARSGFTTDAVRWGDEAGVAMFVFDLQGTPTPVSSRARALMHG